MPQRLRKLHKHVHDGPITRGRAKLLQKEKRIRSDNQIEPPDQTKLDRTTRSDRQIGPIQFGPPVWTTKRNTHNSRFLKDLKAHEYRWKSYEVYFPTQQVSHHFDFPIRIYGRIIEDWSEGQESAQGFILLDFPYKTVPIYNVSWCILHMPGKLMKSSFTPNKRLIVSTSEQGEMVILLKTAQRPRRRAGIKDHLVNDSPVGLPSSNVETSVHTYLGGCF